MDEATKAATRRKRDPRYNTYIKGRVLDVGCGTDPVNKSLYPKVTDVTPYDLILGHTDAIFLPELAGQAGTFDCVHASHLLEHLTLPGTAVGMWLTMLKPGGHLVVTVPEEDLYEQGIFPSRWNGDHKTTWTIFKLQSWSPVSVNVFDLLTDFPPDLMQIISVIRVEEGYDFTMSQVDQTLGSAESAIEFVLRRKSILLTD